MISKVLICPYFGDLPGWMDAYWANADRLAGHGYEFLLDDNEDEFRDRVRDKLQIEPPRMWGTGNIWDFRPALGLLYADEIKGFDFWGHTDFDCVYGRVENWVTDEFLAGLDIHSNHHDYMCGFWSLYRNSLLVNELFMRSPVWKQKMEDPVPSGWAEMEFTTTVDHAHGAGQIRRKYTFWQTQNLNDYSALRLLPDGRLMEGRTEVMVAHFRRTKVYPPGCRL